MLSLESRLEAMRDPKAADLLGSYYRDPRAALHELLQVAAQRFGGPPPRRHADAIVFSLLDGAAQQWAVDPDHIDLEDLREVLAQTLTDVLAPQPAPASPLPPRRRVDSAKRNSRHAERPPASNSGG